jgi:hypothetical protein
MRLVALILSPWFASILFWLSFTACVDFDGPTSSVDAPYIARVVVEWDPLACGPPHRIAVELEDHAGAKLSASAPCNGGALMIDTPHFGFYYGRVYAWEAGSAIRSVTSIRLAVDEPIVRWLIATPP